AGHGWGREKGRSLESGKKGDCATRNISNQSGRMLVMVLSPGIHNPSSWLRNLALLCRFGDVVGGTIGQRLDRARRLVASGTHEIAAIDEKEVRDIVGPVVLIHHRTTGVPSHATGTHEVHRIRFLLGLAGPHLEGSRGFEQFQCAFGEEALVFEIVRMVLISYA